MNSSEMSRGEFLEEATKWVLKIRSALHNKEALQNKAQLYRAMELEDSLLQFTINEGSFPKEYSIWSDAALLNRYREHAEKLLAAIGSDKDFGNRFWDKIAGDKLEASHVLKRLLNEGDATAPSSASRKKHRLSKSGIDGGGGGFTSQPKKRRKVVKDEDSTMTAPVLLEGDEEDLPPPAAPPLAMVESLGSSSVAGKTVDEGETESILGAPPPPLSLGLKAENAVEKTLNLDIEDKAVEVKVQNSSAWDFFAGDETAATEGSATAVGEEAGATDKVPEEDAAWLGVQQALKKKQEKERREKEEEEQAKIRLANIEKAKEREAAARKKREEEEKLQKEQDLKDQKERELQEREKEREDEKKKREGEGRQVDLDEQYMAMENVESWMEDDDDEDMDF